MRGNDEVQSMVRSPALQIPVDDWPVAWRRSCRLVAGAGCHGVYATLAASAPAQQEVEGVNADDTRRFYTDWPPFCVSMPFYTDP